MPAFVVGSRGVMQNFPSVVLLPSASALRVIHSLLPTCFSVFINSCSPTCFSCLVFADVSKWMTAAVENSCYRYLETTASLLAYSYVIFA